MRFPVADLHCDTPIEILGGADLLRGNPEGHVDLARLRAGGVVLQVMAAFVSPVVPLERSFRRAAELLGSVEALCAALPDDFVAVDDLDGIRSAMMTGHIALLRAVESGQAIENSLGRLESLRRMGVRLLTLTHARHLDWAASCTGSQGLGPGLTAMGEDVVHAMNDLGMIVDVSHAAESTFWDVVRVSRRPFVASHSNAAALCPCPRNLTDDQLRAMADTGSVVGINFVPAFLDAVYGGEQSRRVGSLFAHFDTIERENLDDPPGRRRAAHALACTFQERMAPLRVRMERICDHVEHVMNLVGDEGLAFGSDFDGMADTVLGADGSACYPSILAELGRRGVSDSSLEKIAFRNFLRVVEANWG